MNNHFELDNQRAEILTNILKDVAKLASIDPFTYSFLYMASVICFTNSQKAGVMAINPTFNACLPMFLLMMEQFGNQMPQDFKDVDMENFNLKDFLKDVDNEQNDKS